MNCPACASWKDSGKRITSFTINGTTHNAPEIWLMGWTSAGGDYLEGLNKWAFHCAHQEVSEK